MFLLLFNRWVGALLGTTDGVVFILGATCVMTGVAVTAASEFCGLIGESGPPLSDVTSDDSGPGELACSEIGWSPGGGPYFVLISCRVRGGMHWWVEIHGETLLRFQPARFVPMVTFAVPSILS